MLFEYTEKRKRNNERKISPNTKRFVLDFLLRISNALLFDTKTKKKQNHREQKLFCNDYFFNFSIWWMILSDGPSFKPMYRINISMDNRRRALPSTSYAKQFVIWIQLKMKNYFLKKSRCEIIEWRVDFSNKHCNFVWSVFFKTIWYHIWKITLRWRFWKIRKLKWQRKSWARINRYYKLILHRNLILTLYYWSDKFHLLFKQKVNLIETFLSKIFTEIKFDTFAFILVITWRW